MGSRELENRDNFLSLLGFPWDFQGIWCLDPPPKCSKSRFPRGLFLSKELEIPVGNVVVFGAVCTCFVGNEVLWDGFCSFKILKENPANSTLWNWDLAGRLMPKSFIPGFLG